MTAYLYEHVEVSSYKSWMKRDDNALLLILDTLNHRCTTCEWIWLRIASISLCYRRHKHSAFTNSSRIHRAEGSPKWSMVPHIHVVHRSCAHVGEGL